MATVPYMPLYVADYLADTAHLTTIEHGAYLMLIMSYWQKGCAFTAPDEQTLNVRLANVARMSNSEWSKVRHVMAEFFQVSTDDVATWHHKRIEEELAKFRAKSLKARDAGLASAQRRLNERSTDVGQTFNHTDTDTDTDKTQKNAPKPPAAKTAAVSVPDPVEIWFSSEFWPAYPRREAKTAALKAARAVLRTPELRSKAMAGLLLQLPDLTSKPPDKRPHPATWINGRRWEDEAPLPFVAVQPTGKRSFEESVELVFRERYERGEL